MISDEERDAVREATDIVSLVQETVVLKQRGMDDYWGCCPFHQEKSPSFHVRPSSGLWHCFGCGEGGDVFNYVQRRENLTFPDALRYLAQRAGIELHETRSTRRGPSRSRLEECLSDAQTFYQHQLFRSKTSEAQAARDYLAKRGFGLETCKKWGIGYAPARSQLIADLLQKGFSAQELEAADIAQPYSGRLRDRFFNRVMFAITNDLGATIGFGGRVLGDEKPKYLNSKDSSVWHKSKNLFALDKAKESIVAENAVIIVEGYTDCISLHEAGITNVVAVLGTALTSEHIKILSRFRPKKIISLFDGDEAGQRAAEKLARFIDKTDAQLLVSLLPENLDPAEFLEKNGVEALKTQLNEAQGVMDFVLQKELAGSHAWSPGMRVNKMKAIAEIFAPLNASPVLSSYVVSIADLLNVSTDDVLREIQLAAVRQEQAQRRQAQAAVATNTYELTQEESLRLKTERELLVLLAENRNLFSADLSEISEIAWLDETDASISAVLKKTGPSETQKKLFSSIFNEVEGASQILASAQGEELSERQAKQKVEFLIRNLLFLQKQEELRRIKSMLKLQSLQQFQQEPQIESQQEIQQQSQQQPQLDFNQQFHQEFQQQSQREGSETQDLLTRATTLQKEIALLQKDIVAPLDSLNS